MNILFDLYIRFEGIKELQTLEETEILDEILDFISGRLSPLKDEIEKEETDLAPLNCAIVICLLNLAGDKENTTVPIKIFNYSKELKYKILNSFSPQDFEFLNHKISDINSKWSN